MDNPPQTAEQINAPQVGWCKHSTAPRVPTTHVQSVMQYDILREIEELKRQLTDLHTKDSARTKEHNILVKENRELKAQLDSAAAREAILRERINHNETAMEVLRTEAQNRQRELDAVRAEAAKWEGLYDQDTDALAGEQKRDSYGPIETLNECAKRIINERDAANKACAEMRRAIQSFAADWDSYPRGSNRQLQIRQAFNHAISTDCGKGYRHESEINPLLSALTGIAEYWNLSEDSAVDAAEVCRYTATEALAHAAKLGLTP